MNEQKVKKSSMVTPFFVFFLVHSSQTGVGILSYQRELIQRAGHDAWQSILITGISIHLVILMMYSILKDSEEGDIIAINKSLFGKIIGHLLSACFLGYMALSALNVTRAYIEILQVWIFPMIHTWELTLLVLVVVYYIISGGFRVVTGISFWGVVIPSFLIIMMFFLLKYAHWNNLLPLFNHDISDLLESAKVSMLMYLGFESLFLYYPFIKNRDKSQKWAQIATLYTTILYLILTIISFVYFTQGQLKHTVWATLIITKIFQLPFIERFEYIVIFIWFLVVLPTICCYVWSFTRGVKKMCNIQPKKSLIFVILLIYIASVLIDNRVKVTILGNITSNLGFYIIYGYVPLLYVVTKIKKNYQK
ncbi:GerAB/ArcD/ProY family transporter [Paenibacillus sp. 102]|uniref:GerAB/ArcD/ProY family transporter n=1 Tax=Paenibacillus sp. 102 TaxID=3120823 RepID=UPI0031B9B20F